MRRARKCSGKREAGWCSGKREAGWCAQRYCDRPRVRGHVELKRGTRRLVHVLEIVEMSQAHSREDRGRHDAHARDGGGGVDARSQDRAAKGVGVEAATRREEARPLAVDSLLLSKAHQPRVSDRVKEHWHTRGHTRGNTRTITASYTPSTH